MVCAGAFSPSDFICVVELLSSGGATARTGVHRCTAMNAVQLLPISRWRSIAQPMTRWLRRMLRQVGLDVPFSRFVCPEEVKTIAIDPQWQATVTIRRQMVFLERPEKGDLRDVVPVVRDAHFERHVHASPDALDTGHRSVGANTFIYWMPRVPIIEYAVYTHERSWIAPAGDVRDVLCTEVMCRGKVGVMAIEILAPVVYETAVAFKLPRWHRLASERRLMKHALAQLETSRSRPTLRDGIGRVEWKVARPRNGDRFVCIAFTAKGLAGWQQLLEKTSLGSRLRRLVRIGGRRRDSEAVPTSPGRVLLPR